MLRLIRWSILILMVVLPLLLTAAVAAQDTATPFEVVVTVILVWPTATETPTATEGPSPTPTETTTPTPKFVSEATIEVGGEGQDVAFIYTMDAGQSAIALLLAFIAIILLFGLLVLARGG